MAKLFLGTREVSPTLVSPWIPRTIDNGVYKIPPLTSYSLPSGITSLGSFALAYVFRACTSLKSIDISSLITLPSTSALFYTFYGCTGITGNIDLSNLTSIGATSALSYTFYGCTGITGVDFSSLTTVTGTSCMAQSFRGCTNFATVSFPSLTRIGTNSSSGNYGHFSYAFYGTKIEELRFPELTAIYSTGGSTASYGTFAYNNKLKKIYFPKVTTISYGSGASSSNQASIKNMFSNCAALTEIHFAEANQTAIEACPGYSTAWASSATIYFDL